MNEWINKVEKASVRLSIPSFPTLIGRNVTRQGAARDSFDGVIRLFTEIGRLIKTTLWFHTGPPNGPVLFCSLASVGACRMLFAVVVCRL